MDINTMKTFGFGDYPDWRWRCAMRNVKHIREADTPADYFIGPGEEALLEDGELTQLAFPYLKRCFHPEAGYDMPEARMTAMEIALGAANEEYITPGCASLNLEAGILGGRQVGDLLAVSHAFTLEAQIAYERLFYDVRPFLGDANAICRFVFRDKERLRARGAFDLICKFTAYGLGFDEYHMWRKGSPSDRVKRLHSSMNALFRFLDGMQLLGVDAPDDMEKAFANFFTVLPDILAFGKSGAGAKRGYHGYTANEMVAISEMIPEAEAAMVRPHE